MCANQKAAVKTEFGETKEFDIEKGVRQGCILSPLLFNIYAEKIMREALDKMGRRNWHSRRVVTKLRYADDTIIIAGTKEDLIEIMERVRKTSEKTGLYISVLKTKVMPTGYIGEVTVDWKIVEVVTTFILLGALITRDGLCDKEIRRRIAVGKAAMGGLTATWKDRGIMLAIKVKPVKALVFPV